MVAASTRRRGSGSWTPTRHSTLPSFLKTTSPPGHTLERARGATKASFWREKDRGARLVLFGQRKTSEFGLLGTTKPLRAPGNFELAIPQPRVTRRIVHAAHEIKGCVCPRRRLAGRPVRAQPRAAFALWSPGPSTRAATPPKACATLPAPSVLRSPNASQNGTTGSEFARSWVTLADSEKPVAQSHMRKGAGR